MDKHYTIGIDFGTLTARGVLIDVSNGEEIAVSIFGYQDAIIEYTLPETNTILPAEYALQNPQDYQFALTSILSELWRKADISPSQIIGIGIDFTSCTMIPLNTDLTPLCYDKAFRKNKHSWPKLWKHHAAQKEADYINAVAHQRNESFIKRYGNCSSCEWLFPKILQILNEAPEIYNATYRFVEASDWIFYLLTGELKKNNISAGFKAFWNQEDGYPSKSFFAALDPRLENVIEEKIGTDVFSIDSIHGTLSRQMAESTGLKEGTAVSLGNIDAHISFPATGANENSSMLMIMGTSLCHILVSPKKVLIDGICGVVKDGILPGYYGYEAGQASVGDIYDWFVSNSVPNAYLTQVKQFNINIFDLMNEKMAALKPGASGIMALDWWNGNRSLLVDYDLSGLLIGLSLTTTTEEIYRALVEATAFGSRKIIEEFEKKGLQINQIFACGGLSFKAPQIMQIFSDIIGKPIIVSSVKQTSALGAAMFGAVAAGLKNGGYNSIFDAMKKMVAKPSIIYSPNPENKEIYDTLYRQYTILHDYFGKNNDSIMKTLRTIKRQQRATE